MATLVKVTNAVTELEAHSVKFTQILRAALRFLNEIKEIV